MVHVFGNNQLDEPQRCLLRDGCAIALEPKVFDLLLYLIRNRDRVVGRDELLASIWPGVYVSDAALATCVKRARRAVADEDPEQRIIQTIHRRGFRFVAAVVSRESGPAQPSEPGVKRAATPPSGPFVGRAVEMQRLQDAWTDARAGRGRLLLIEGEPGIGKTRLLEEFAAWAGEAGGAEVLVGRCYDGQGVPGFWAWVQIIRSYVAAHSTDEVREVMGPAAGDIALLVPSLRLRLPDLEMPVPMDPAQGRARLFDSVAAVLGNAAAKRPLVIVLEDLHWLQDSSLHLLQFLVRQISTAPILMLGTCRTLEVERGSVLEETIARLARDGACERVPLTGLDDVAVDTLLNGLVGSSAQRTVGRVLSERTQGNPFFIQELVRYWVSTGVIDWERGEIPDLSRIESLGVPNGVRVAIGRRLAQLNDATRRALAVAAVAGDSFTSTLVHAVTNLPNADLVDALDAAIGGGIVLEVSGAAGRYTFAHALTRATLYHGLTATRRAQLHGQVAEALEAAHSADPEGPLADLAYHFLQGASDGHVDKAVHYAVQAAAQLSARFAHEDAARLLQGALEILERERPGDRYRRCELLLALGEAQRRSGVPCVSRELFNRAADLARELDAPPLLATAAAQLAVHYWPHYLEFHERPIRLLEDALVRLGGSDDSMRARLLALLAGALFMVPGSAQRREALSREAEELAWRTGNPTTLGRVLDDVAIALWDPNHVQERLQLATQFRDLGVQVGDKEMEVKAYGWRLLSFLEQGNLRAVDADLEEAEPLANTLRQPQYWWFAKRFRFTRALLAGRMEDAERLREESLEAARRVDEGGALLGFGVQTFALCRERGTLADLEMAVKQYTTQFPSLPWKWVMPFVHSQQGEDAAARAAFEDLAANDFGDLPSADGPSTWMGVVATLAEACAALGDQRRAAILYDLLKPYEHQWIVFQYGFACFGSVRRYLGLLATVLGRWHDATEHFEEAMHAHTLMATPCELARTQHDFARMLYARGRERDRREALPLLDQVSKTARELKLGYLAKGADQLRAMQSVISVQS
jgi:DNA-binding winged helix-turn-helix (wHTH) protein